jgi:hypothetical protein
VIYLYLDRFNAWLNAASHNKVTEQAATHKLPGNAKILGMEADS